MTFKLYLCGQPNMISRENMHSQEEVWIYAAIYFVLFICSVVGITFIGMTVVMGYFMCKDHFYHNLTFIVEKTESNALS